METTDGAAVLMDERGNVIDESETREVRGDDAETTPAEKLLLTDAQLELVARTLREKHGVEEVEPREIAGLLPDRLRTKRKYAGVRSAREDEDDDADRVGRAGDDATTNAATRGARSDSDSVGSGATRISSRSSANSPRACSRTRRGERGGRRGSTGNRRGDRLRLRVHARTRAASAHLSPGAWCTTVDSNLVAEAGSAARSAPAPWRVRTRRRATRMSRGAWRTVRRADDPAPPQNAGRSAAASTPLDPSDRRRIVDAELARVENTPRLKALSAKQRWTVAGAMTGFLTDTLAAASRGGISRGGGGG